MSDYIGHSSPSHETLRTAKRGPNRRQVMTGALAGAAVTALPACSGGTVAADRQVDAVLIGGGIMSATLGAMLRQLEPDWSIELFERRDAVSQESSLAWHNSGTGHSALCELNYTPEAEDGSISPTRALRINEEFQITRQFYAGMVERGAMRDPRSFINSVPHMSFVMGERDIDFLERRYAALSPHPLFSGMDYTTDRARIAEWAPLLMEGRAGDEPVAATWSSLGTDVDYGEVTRQLTASLEGSENFALNTSTEVEDLRQNADGTWRVVFRDVQGGDAHAVDARFVFIGAGGAALLLLQRSGIPEAENYAGFPVGGAFLMNDDPAVAERHLANAYGRAGEGAPPMSTPHLDTRFIEGQRRLAFGPFATFSTKFLMDGSSLDLFRSASFHNVLPMLDVGFDQMSLVRYLVGEVMQGRDDRIEQLRRYFPAATEEGWRLVQAGQRVQIIRRSEGGGGELEFGTEIVHSQDGSLAALLGASPGASTAPSIMLDLLLRTFPEEMRSERWRTVLTTLVPSYGTILNENPEALAESWAFTSGTLGLSTPPEVEAGPVRDAA